MRGLEHLEDFDEVLFLTNTVITNRSYRQLPGVVEALSHLRRLVQMDFWTYWPMKESDEKDLIVSHPEAAPYLRDAIRLAREYGRMVEAKNFPECLLREDRIVLDNNQPELFIDPSFWNEFDRNGFRQCAHRDVCQSSHCLGLNTAYIEKYGWQEQLLSPFTTV